MKSRLQFVSCLFAIAMLLHIEASQGVCQEDNNGFLQRKVGNEFQVRVMSWNVRADSVFAGKVRYNSFRRIVRAIEPDVICLQEVIRGDELGPLMQKHLPLNGEQAWHVHAAGDNAVVSRFPLQLRQEEMPVPFPIPRAGLPDFAYGQAMCLVDIPDEQSDKDFYIIAMHNKSRSDDKSIRLRERQSDSIVRWIRNLKLSKNQHSISQGTPLLIAGDMNVLASEPMDPAHHLTTLLTGNIVDEATFGPDCPLDWDGTYLIEVKPKHNSRQKEFYTWRVDQSPYAPGALDRMIYTDSVLMVKHSFVLNTTAMTEAELKESGLLKTDVLWEGQPGNFDHMPLVADFVIRATKDR